MPAKIDGVDLTAMKYNGAPVTAAKLNGGVVWPAGPPPNLYGRMIARTDALTVVHFKTTSDSSSIQYRAYPGGTITGELLGEYVKTGELARSPLIRGLDTVSSTHLRFRRSVGDNSSRKGVNAPSSPTWSTYIATGRGANERIYVMDITSREWLSLNPSDRDGGATGGDYVSWAMGRTSWFSNQRSSFATRTQLQAWVGAVGSTTVHEIVVALVASTTFTPVF